MELRGDDRAQSVQIGAILLFGILIITMATFQATVVPDQNAGVEFDHSRAVQSDMQDLRNGLLRAAGGEAASTRISLGTTYPSRMLFINPPPPSGRIRTVGADDPSMNVTLETDSGNVTVGTDYENAKDYWANASDAGLFNTSHIVYTPDYAEYNTPPTTVYENSVLYNRFVGGQNTTLSGQQLVQGTTVNLVALRGDLQASRAGAYTVDVTTISEGTRTVTVRSEINNPLSINITSALPASRWNDSALLGSQPRATAHDAGTVTVDGEAYHRVEIRLEEGETYELRTSAVGVGALNPAEAVTDPAYLVVTEEYQPVANGSTETMTVEVRDRFNNPVTGADVNVRTDGTYLQVNETDNASFETNAEGQAEIRYEGTAVTESGDAWLNASIGGETYEHRNVTGIDVPEFIAGGGGGDDGGEINPGTTGELMQTDAVLTGGGNVDVTFDNTDDQSISVTAVRVNFYYRSSGQPVTEATSISWNVSGVANNVGVGESYVEFTPTANITNKATATIDFDKGVKNQDFFVLTLVYEIDGETERTTYFINPLKNP